MKACPCGRDFVAPPAELPAGYVMPEGRVAGWCPTHLAVVAAPQDPVDDDEPVDRVVTSAEAGDDD